MTDLDAELWEADLDFDTRLAWLAFLLEATNIDAPEGGDRS